MSKNNNSLLIPVSLSIPELQKLVVPVLPFEYEATARKKQRVETSKYPPPLPPFVRKGGNNEEREEWLQVALTGDYGLKNQVKARGIFNIRKHAKSFYYKDYKKIKEKRRAKYAKDKGGIVHGYTRNDLPPKKRFPFPI